MAKVRRKKADRGFVPRCPFCQTPVPAPCRKVGRVVCCQCSMPFFPPTRKSFHETWLGFCVRFFCGAALGSLVGFILWWFWDAHWELETTGDEKYLYRTGGGAAGPWAWLAIPACALLLGLAVAWWGGDFWGPRQLYDRPEPLDLGG
jgi:hypothetical protein